MTKKLKPFEPSQLGDTKSRYFADFPGSVRAIARYGAPACLMSSADSVIGMRMRMKWRRIAYEFIEAQLVQACLQFGDMGPEFFADAELVVNNFEQAMFKWSRANDPEVVEWHRANPLGMISVTLEHQIQLGFGRIPVSGCFTTMVVKDKRFAEGAAYSLTE